MEFSMLFKEPIFGDITITLSKSMVEIKQGHGTPVALPPNLLHKFIVYLNNIRAKSEDKVSPETEIEDVIPMKAFLMQFRATEHGDKHLVLVYAHDEKHAVQRVNEEAEKMYKERYMPMELVDFLGNSRGVLNLTL